MSWLIPPVVALVVLTVAAVVAARYAPAGWPAEAERALRHRLTPLAFGVITALALGWVAGGTLDVEPISTDEAAYLLQARIFASGHITAPGAPIPEFFEQAWVVVAPRIYSKYPPGNSLMLAPGVALGLPWLIPFLLNGVAGCLLFALLRRAVGAPAAVLTWSAWVLSGMAMAWQTTYFSEVTLQVCWLGATAAVWQWWDGGARRWLILAALLAGFGAVTRPLSMLLLSIPLAGAVAVAARRSARWREVAVAALAGLAVVMLLPAWNLGTTGSVTRSPLREYTETYIPWDRLGFAIESTAAVRPAPPDLAPMAQQLMRVHREHTVARLPATLGERVGRVAGNLFTHWRILLLVTALVGVFALRGPALLALSSVVLSLLGHLIWAHQSGWTLYYAEGAALWFLPGALGVVWLLQRGMRARAPTGDFAPQVGLAVVLAAPVLFALSIIDSSVYREWRSVRAAESRALTDAVARGPERAIYFVRYGPMTSGHPALIRNDPFLADARAWVVYDLGSRDQELLSMAPDRQGFLIDEADRSIEPLPRAVP